MQSKATRASQEMAEEPQEGKSAGPTRARTARTELGWPAFIPLPGTKALSQLARPETSQRLTTPPGSMPLWLHKRSKKLPSPQPSIARGRKEVEAQPGDHSPAQPAAHGWGREDAVELQLRPVCMHTRTHKPAARADLGSATVTVSGKPSQHTCDPKHKDGAQGSAEVTRPLLPGPRGPRRHSSHSGTVAEVCRLRITANDSICNF